MQRLRENKMKAKIKECPECKRDSLNSFCEMCQYSEKLCTCGQPLYYLECCNCGYSETSLDMLFGKI